MEKKDSTKEKFVWPAFEFVKETLRDSNSSTIGYAGKTFVRIKQNEKYYLVSSRYWLNITAAKPLKEDFFIKYFYPQFKKTVERTILYGSIPEVISEEDKKYYFLDENQDD